MTKPHFSRILLIRLSLIGGGLLLAALMIGLLFALFPDLRPGGQRFVFRERDGDSFRQQPGFVRPPDGNRVLEDFIRRKDKDGFRQAKVSADHYPIIALGDSFTEGGETNWVDVLAKKLDIPVRNLGWRGWGPLQEAEALRQFGDDDHTWVLIGYFEGNDLSNVKSAYEEIQETGDLNIDRNTDTGAGIPTEIVTQPDGNYLYPLAQLNGHDRYELAYISDYIWWLNGSKETFESSQNFALLRDALETIKTLSGSACVGLVYMPSKEHIYFPYADPDGNRRYVLENGLALSLDSAGWLTFGDLAPQDYNSLLANFDNQRDAVQELTKTLGLYFIDLTPAFQAIAASNQLTYYIYDSHWSAQGHRLAGETVASFLQNTLNCPLETK